jgi:toxin YoeB
VGKYWYDEAWEDYEYWQEQDRKTLRKLNRLIKDIIRNGNMQGIGKPEPLTGDFSGRFSRHIDEKNRIIYRLEDDGTLKIYQCKDHYNDK